MRLIERDLIASAALALRRHRLPRFWLGLTLGLVAAGVGAAYWWERELPQRLEQAAATGNLNACLRYSEQLESLRWLGGSAPKEQGQCRRLKAAELWRQRQWAQALRLQWQLVNSQAAQPSDQRQLDRWVLQLQQQSLDQFQQGNLKAALQLLVPIGDDHNSAGNATGDSYKEIWNRNRLLAERSQKLVAQKRWWEALDALTRLDHPWWKGESRALQVKVQAGINALAGQDREHDGHGALPHTVPAAELDARVQAQIAKGLDEWTAFTAACKSLGGKVIEAGPETACQRP